jgi:hypothetical protein
VFHLQVEIDPFPKNNGMHGRWFDNKAEPLTVVALQTVSTRMGFIDHETLHFGGFRHSSKPKALRPRTTTTTTVS